MTPKRPLPNGSASSQREAGSSYQSFSVREAGPAESMHGKKNETESKKRNLMVGTID